jgi:hypothetical protein
MEAWLYRKLGVLIGWCLERRLSLQVAQLWGQERPKLANEVGADTSLSHQGRVSRVSCSTASTVS